MAVHALLPSMLVVETPEKAFHGASSEAEKNEDAVAVYVSPPFTNVPADI